MAVATRTIREAGPEQGVGRKLQHVGAPLLPIAIDVTAARWPRSKPQCNKRSRKRSGVGEHNGTKLDALLRVRMALRKNKNRGPVATPAGHILRYLRTVR
jgi:hypothetical protein